MDQNNLNNKTNKCGKRISTEDLLKYIKTNKEIIKSIKFVDLNDSPVDNKKLVLEKNKLHELTEINYLPSKLSTIFKLENGQKYLHSGCLQSISQNDGQQLFVSFYSSILSCLIQNFFVSSLSEQILFTTKLLNRLKIESCGNTYEQQFYKKRYGWNSEDIKNDMNLNLITPKIMKFVSDFFHINIFILDLAKDSLHFGGNEYIPFKRTIFLIKYFDDTFEPLHCGNNRVFTVDNDLIKEIRNNLDCVNIFQFTDRHLLGFEETEEELINYLPKQTQIKIKKEKPEFEYDKKIIENNKNKKSTNNYDSDSDTNSINEHYSDIYSNDEYDDDMNAYKEDSEEENVKLVNKKIKQLSDEENTKQKKKSKQQIITYKLSDIKSTLKLDELKEIALNLGLSSKGTKAILIDAIKNKLNNK